MNKLEFVIKHYQACNLLHRMYLESGDISDLPKVYDSLSADELLKLANRCVIKAIQLKDKKDK